MSVVLCKVCVLCAGCVVCLWKRLYALRYAYTVSTKYCLVSAHLLIYYFNIRQPAETPHTIGVCVPPSRATAYAPIVTNSKSKLWLVTCDPPGPAPLADQASHQVAMALVGVHVAPRAGYERVPVVPRGTGARRRLVNLAWAVLFPRCFGPSF